MQPFVRYRTTDLVISQVPWRREAMLTTDTKEKGGHKERRKTMGTSCFKLVGESQVQVTDEAGV